MAVEQIVFSGSTNGEPLLLTDDATPGETFHTCSATHKERVFLWATCTGGANKKLTLELGATTSPLEQLITDEGGEQKVLEGFLNDGSATVLAAFAETASTISIHGYVLQEET